MTKTILTLLLLLQAARAEYVVPWYGTNLPAPPAPPADPSLFSVDLPLSVPAVGSYSAQVVATNVVELFRATAKYTNAGSYTNWSFIDATGSGSLPATSDFVVFTNGTAVPVSSVGFKRRVLYGPSILGRSGQARDLRVGSQLYLKLGDGVPSNCVVAVSNVSGALWSGYNYATTNAWTNYSPAVHVNQIGYLPGQTKHGYVGFYLGSLGELTNFTPGAFYLLTASNTVAHSNALVLRPDTGFSLGTYNPLPYQKVYDADFSAFTNTGQYRLYVPGLGCSYPFWVDNGVAAAYARAYALGVYHQRCGTNEDLPWTRHAHGICHTNFAYIPTTVMAMSNSVNNIISGEGDLDYIGQVHYPYLSTNRLDTVGGHHDAGDYSKYTTSVAKFVHFMSLAMDAFPGVRHLDNLGIPESGDGISDVMQEMKWEADYLAKIQDTDGGFYMLCYPTNGQYQNVLPDDPGNSQLMMPKSTVATAAAVGALAEAASSPLFKATYPATAASYLSKALAGWTFLTNAFAAHGFEGSFQTIMFQGAVFGHTDEVYYASSALYLATSNSYFSNYAVATCPQPFSQDNRRWSWWGCYEGYGFGFHLWAFATNRVAPAMLNSSYVSNVVAEVMNEATNNRVWSGLMAYGASLYDAYKAQNNPAWHFSSDWALDSAVAYALAPNTNDLAVLLKNLDYEMGANPLNVCFVTGSGYRRQHETVNTLALYDDRDLPPSGIPLGNIQSGYFDIYGTAPELEYLSYPPDGSGTTRYWLFDRWADAFNTTTEWVVSQAARSLAAAALVASLAQQTNQVWSNAPGYILLSTNRVVVGGPAGTCLASNLHGISLTNALVTWEVVDQSSSLSSGDVARRLAPTNAGTKRIEFEALLPDGRRVFARTNFLAVELVTNNIEAYQSTPLSNNTAVVGWWKLDGDYKDNRGRSSDLTPAAAVALDSSSYVYTNRPEAGGCALAADLGDHLSVAVPNSALSGASAISIEAMFFVSALKASGSGHADMLAISGPGANELKMYQNTEYAAPIVVGKGATIADQATVAAALATGRWQHWKITLDSSGYTVKVDGQTVATLAAASDLSGWSSGGNSTVTVGDFDGWVDEVVVKGTTTP